MPNERTPATPLPRDFHKILGHIPYRVHNNEDWESVARKFNVDVQDLIHFNFFTNIPEEVNWYLRFYTGCNKKSPSGYNWMFSDSASPGIIYIPGHEVDFDDKPEEVCVWTGSAASKMLDQLYVIAQSIPGNEGARIQKIVLLARRLGYPQCEDLWYYNPGPVAHYVDFHTNNADRREMTKATQGQMPFDGDAGVIFGPWRIYPFKDLFKEFACGHSTSAVKNLLLWFDGQIYSGWYAMKLVEAQTTMGGGSAYGPLVDAFLEHVYSLSQQDGHLYSAWVQ